MLSDVVCQQLELVQFDSLLGTAHLVTGIIYSIDCSFRLLKRDYRSDLF